VLRRLVVPLVAPIAVRLLPGSSGGSRLFQYIAQIRIHYRLDPNAKPTSPRDPVIGRRLPWTGDNHVVLRAACWQIHGYGEVGLSDAPDLGMPVHVFPAALGTGLRPGLFYLVRPDGFVAASAPPADADMLFRHALGR
jgi:hypothetical protein